MVKGVVGGGHRKPEVPEAGRNSDKCRTEKISKKSAIKNKVMKVFARKCRHGEEDVFVINCSLIELIWSQQRTLLLAGLT